MTTIDLNICGGLTLTPPEEIKKIAKKYAEEVVRAYIAKEGAINVVIMGEVKDLTATKTVANTAERAFQWLSKDYCIVPKNKARELHTRNAKIITQSDDKVLNAYSTGVMTAIERLFGKSLFEEK